MKVTFLRHAKSIFNELKLSGKDCDLSEFGQTQAKDLSGNWDLIVISVMKRTRMTYALSSLHSERILFTDRCREWKQDICDFLEEEDESQKESREDLHLRVLEFKEWLKDIAGDAKTILVITHADFVESLNGGQKYLQNAEFWSCDM